MDVVIAFLWWLGIMCSIIVVVLIHEIHKSDPRFFFQLFLHIFKGEHLVERDSVQIANARVICRCFFCKKEFWVNTLDPSDPDYLRPVTEKILIRSHGLNAQNFTQTREEISRQLRFLRNNEEYRAWQTEDWRRRNPLPSEDKEVDTV